MPVPYEDLPVRLPEMTEGETNKMAGDDAVSPLGSRIVKDMLVNRGIFYCYHHHQSYHRYSNSNELLFFK